MALPQVGQVFGRYRIDDLIGRGGMGVVLGATDTALGRRVALKVVAPDLGGTEEFRARFEREAATLARLDSAHVIAIYDYGTQDDCPYIATQYVGGGDLGALLHERGPMVARDALSVCAQVADALDDAHRAGVVHRDVKPTNVLVRERDADEPHVYLCDFGIARTGTGGLTAVGAVAGTWSYLAPENGRGVPASEASDVYALGCLLWATLTGHPPYRGTDVAIALAHQRDPVPQLPGDGELVAAVNEVLRHSMAKDPADRYADAGAQRLALLAAAELPGADAVLPVGPTTDPTIVPHTGVRTPGAESQPSQPSQPSHPSHPSHPSQPGSAPPAWRPPSSPPAPPALPAHHTPTPTPATRRRRGPLLVAALVALVLLGGGVAAYVVTRGDDDPGPSAGPGGSPGGDPTGDPSASTDADPASFEGPVTGDLDGDGFGDLSLDYQPREGDTILTTTWRSDSEAGEFVDQQDSDLGPVGGDPTWRVRGNLDEDDTTDVLTFRQPGGQGPTAVTGELSGGGSVNAEVDFGEANKGRASGNDALADVDGDGDDDLLHIDVVDKKLVLTTRTFDGTTIGEAVDGLTLTDDLDYLRIRVGDFDGDRRADIATLVFGLDANGGYPGQVEIRLGDGKGGFAEEPVSASFTSGQASVIILAGDIDADGDDDVIVADADTRSIVFSVYGYDEGTITPAANVGSVRYVNTAPVSLVTSDVNGDRKDDVVAVGLQKTGGTARVQVAVSSGTSFTSSRWLAWDQLFAAKTNADDQRFEALEDARW